MAANPKLSVIVPFYNEEDSIAPLHAAIVGAVEPLGVPFEMVFVNDGSRDRTQAIAVEIARKDPRVRVVKFRRNYGQTAAMAAGIEHATGEILVTMDGDLQNDPADIPLLLAKLDEGFDAVLGKRAGRQDKLLLRKVPSWCANWLIRKVTGVQKTAAATEVRKASRKVLESTKVDDGIRRVEIGSQLLHREGRYGTSELVTVTEEPQWVAGRWVANNYFLDCLFWADTLKVVYMPPPEDIGGER